jgi:HSP20 family protein
MSTLEQLREGLGQAWDHLGEGWRHLYDRASRALTKFTPVRREGELDNVDDYVVREGARWALLAAEVRENDDQIVVRLEAPGLNANDFDIQVLNNMLVVSGEKHIEREETRGRFHLMECAYGNFERTVPLPAGVDETGAHAKYRNGVLRITLPKTKSRSQQRITIE